MNLTEDEIIGKYAKRCEDCNRKTLLPQEYEFTCIACGFNEIKTKHELSKIQRKKKIFINRLKYAGHKIFCICIVLYKIYEDNNYNELLEVLSTLKKRKLKISNTLIEKYGKKCGHCNRN